MRVSGFWLLSRVALVLAFVVYVLTTVHEFMFWVSERTSYLLTRASNYSSVNSHDRQMKAA